MHMHVYIYIYIYTHVSFFDEGPVLETLRFFEISHDSYQLLNFLPFIKLICLLCNISSHFVSFVSNGFLRKFRTISFYVA